MRNFLLFCLVIIAACSPSNSELSGAATVADEITNPVPIDVTPIEPAIVPEEIVAKEVTDNVSVDEIKVESLESQTVPKNHEVIIDNGFSPSELQVVAGDSVTWTNNQQRRVSKISSSIGKFFSERLQEGDSYTKVFDIPGNFPYIDAGNKLKRGTIIVNTTSRQ